MPFGTPTNSTSDDNYLASLTDLTIGLLFIFIIILMGFALNYRQAETAKDQATQRQQAENQRLAHSVAQLQSETGAQQQARQRLAQVVGRLTDNDSLRRSLLRQIQALLEQQGLRVLIDEDNGIVRLPEALLFASGEAQFRPEGARAMQQLAKVLLDILPCYSLSPSELSQHCDQPGEARLEAVLIEGHTDKRPINTPDFKDNWALASARALNTYQALAGHAPALETLQNPQQQALLSVSAYEARRPVAQGDSDENRRQNRRIDLRFLMAAPLPDLLESARHQIKMP